VDVDFAGDWAAVGTRVRVIFTLAADGTGTLYVNGSQVDTAKDCSAIALPAHAYLDWTGVFGMPIVPDGQVPDNYPGVGLGWVDLSNFCGIAHEFGYLEGYAASASDVANNKALSDPYGMARPIGRWDKHLTASATAAVASNLLTLDAPTSADKLFYSHPINAAGSGRTVMAEFALKVTDSGTAVNTGQCVTIFDGSWQYTLWLREAGLNIDGEPEVEIALNDYEHRFLFTSDGAGSCRVIVDGQFLQQGTASTATTKTDVAFGTWVSSSF
jgi:hypothetical protein